MMLLTIKRERDHVKHIFTLDAQGRKVYEGIREHMHHLNAHARILYEFHDNAGDHVIDVSCVIGVSAVVVPQFIEMEVNTQKQSLLDKLRNHLKRVTCVTRSC